MNTSDRLPIHHESGQNRTIKRHHTARYYAHRVRESLTTRVSKVICATILLLLFVLGVVAFILWLSLRPHRPRFHIIDFSIPGLDQPNGFQNPQIIFNVTARNSNQHIGFYYGKMEGTIFYNNQQIGYKELLDPFYQESKNTTVIYRVLSGEDLKVTNQLWLEFMNAATRGPVIFRLDITSYIRFKVFTWDSHHHRMHASCDVGVGPDGSLLAAYKIKKCPVYFT